MIKNSNILIRKEVHDINQNTEEKSDKSLRKKNVHFDNGLITHNLLKACRKNKRSAQGELYKILSPELYPICLRYARDKDQAMDYLHDSFMTIFDKIGTYSGNGSFKGWAKRIASNTALMEIRKNKKLIFSDKIEIKETEEIDMDQFESISSYQLEDLFRIIQKLPEGCRAVFNLYVLDGYKHQDIAKELGVTEGTSKSQLFKAKKLLKEIVKNI